MIVISVGGSGIPEVTFRPLPFAEHRTFAKRSHVKDRKVFDMTYIGSTRVVDQASAHSLPRVFTVAGRHMSQEPCLGVNVNSKRPVGRVSRVPEIVRACLAALGA